MSDSVDLGGQISLGNKQAYGSASNEPAQPEKSQQNTLDEPVLETIKRDLRMIFHKLKYVMHPRMKDEAAKELRNWDLWGPLILCLALAFVLTLKSSESDDTLFGTIFAIIWGGSCILTLNAKFLGGKISFFQSVCVLGYCIFPILLAAIIITIFSIPFKVPFYVNLIVCGLAAFWAISSSIGFIKALVIEQKKALAAYPVILFYLSLTWFVLLAFAQD